MVDTTDLKNHCAFCGAENPNGHPHKVAPPDLERLDPAQLSALADEARDLDRRLGDVRERLQAAVFSRVGFLPECLSCHDKRLGGKGATA